MSTRSEGRRDERAAVLEQRRDRVGGRGLSVLEYLAREEILKETRLIVLSSPSSEAAARAAYALGARDDIGRSFSISDVMQRVRRALTASV